MPTLAGCAEGLRFLEGSGAGVVGGDRPLVPMRGL